MMLMLVSRADPDHVDSLTIHVTWTSDLDKSALSQKDRACPCRKSLTTFPGLLCSRLMIDKLEFFIAVAREKSFSRAAESCGVTQPTLSAAIKQLEDSLGVLLDQSQLALPWADGRGRARARLGEADRQRCPRHAPGCADLEERPRRAFAHRGDSHGALAWSPR